MKIKHRIRKLIWKIGYDLVPFSPITSPVARGRKIFEAFNIDVVLDVGANTGQFAEQIRNDFNFNGRIISFEPISNVCNELYKKAKSDKKWEIMPFALGDQNAKSKINISSNLQSSSLLKILPRHVKSASESKYIGSETIEVKTLDSIFNKLCTNVNNTYLKIDTQGYESNVIIGSENSLKYIDTVQVEMSLVPLYKDALLFNKMYDLLINKGYTLVSIEPVFIDKNTGQLLQVDCIFHRY